MGEKGAAAMAETTDVEATHRSVLVSLAGDCAEMLALGVTAWATGSVALRAAEPGSSPRNRA
jgi:hypothetical protein